MRTHKEKIPNNQRTDIARHRPLPRTHAVIRLQSTLLLRVVCFAFLAGTGNLPTLGSSTEAEARSLFFLLPSSKPMPPRPLILHLRILTLPLSRHTSTAPSLPPLAPAESLHRPGETQQATLFTPCVVFLINPPPPSSLRSSTHLRTRPKHALLLQSSPKQAKWRAIQNRPVVPWKSLSRPTLHR